MSIESETYSVTTNSDYPENILTKLNATKVDNNSFDIDLGKNYTVMNLTKDLEQNKLTILDIRPKGNRLERLFLNSLKN